MNKFAIIALLAFTCQLAMALPTPDLEETDDAISQLAPASDESETAQLEGKMRLFSDYCINTRDSILAAINTASRDAASQAVATLFNSVAEIGTEALETQKRASETLGNQIRNPNAPIEASGREFDEPIVEGQQKIQADSSIRKSFVQAIVSTLTATGNALAQTAARKLSGLNVDISVAGGLILHACDALNVQDSIVRQEFEQYKEEIVAQEPSLAGVTANQVPCLTSRKVMQASALCNFAKVARGPLVALYNLRDVKQAQMNWISTRL